MLVLTRKAGESIRIGDDIEIMVVDTIGGRIRLGITAPKEIKVFRKELLDSRQSREGENSKDV